MDREIRGVGRPEIYTLEFCLAELKEMYNTLIEDTEFNYVTLQSLIKHKPYSRQRVWDWLQKHGDNTEFSDIYQKLWNELEDRLVILGLKGKANPAVAIFAMKNYYGMKDRQEIEHRVTEIPPLPNIIIE